jgi:peroxiredoxin
LGVRVLLVTFSSSGYARKFQEEVCGAFPLLINRERDLYATYDLESSLLRSWGPKNLWSYVKRFLRGEKIKGIQGDSTQLGGDFIIGADRNVRYVYRSDDPTDRPPVEELMDVLRERERRS